MLWIKAFHIFFIVSWFAGLLYLPRLFVYHADTTDEAGHRRFCIMEKRLFSIMTIGGIGTLVTGLWLVFGWWWPVPAGHHWLGVKLLLVLALIAFHLACWGWLRRFAAGHNPHTTRYFRLVNEIPALILLAIVILAVVRPF